MTAAGTSGMAEFRQHWRPLLASFLGLGSALSLNSYILSTFAPYMIDEFGWSRSQWALLGIVQLLVMVCLPVVGRLTDIYGVRRVAAAGALSFPAFLLAIAMMNGDIRVYLVIYVAQTIICSTTTAVVYSRVVATAFRLRRGIALGICGSSPPLFGALGAPLLSAFVADHGWRSGYAVVAAFCLVCSLATLALLREDKAMTSAAVFTAGSDAGAPEADAIQAAVDTPGTRAGRSQGVYRTVFARPVFWIMLAATFLANLPFSLASSQLKLVVLEQGLSDGTAALLVSVFALGSILGRVISGTALDYLPSHVIAGTVFGLPFVGLLLLAWGPDTPLAVGLAILLVGLSFGGEGDIVPYLVTRYFGLAVYSTVLGLLSAAMGASMALGNGILGMTLASSGRFDLYLVIAAAGSLTGSVLFLLLGLRRFRAAVQDA